MNRNLTDEDVEHLARRLVEIFADRLVTHSPRASASPPSPTPVPTPTTGTHRKLPDKLAFNLKELSVELGVSKVSIYRLEARGLLKSLPYLSQKYILEKKWSDSWKAVPGNATRLPDGDHDFANRPAGFDQGMRGSHRFGREAFQSLGRDRLQAAGRDPG